MLVQAFSCPINSLSTSSTTSFPIVYDEAIKKKQCVKMTEVLREIGSSVAKLRSLLAESKKDLQRIKNLQDSLTSVLSDIWESPQLRQVTDSPPQWKEFLSLVASGRVLSVAAQADGALAAAKDFSAKSWLADGHAYSRWLGRGVVVLASQDDPSSAVMLKRRAAAAQLCGRSFGIGYQGEMLPAIVRIIRLTC